ncbi:phospholipase/carboxylesterase [Meinhardsimonia xiamenensis]|jgi:phospholipase/carboxylesterase|uniref:Phospholipase/carboxylesterase n=1 Tax=Meinhardsimonia xiamenensis TaxID=990712 RepID=A0A1G9D6Z3_9RHOB|nr:alpha/beta fold hydrolase [Meinhardsimonia xiamenensis]PRX38107.1 phospholipase/carboxylesterase [Meinhardsimonia xiamenensis]SDK59682.1 phospholipase/carboxylesterase [Meinhardsimonia xiamenensis]
MTRELKSERRGPPEGEASAVVVFLHGYGADGADLLGLAEPLSPHLPGTAFYAPDAPEPCAVNPGGRQWFPIPWIDGSSEEQATASMLASARDLDAFLDQVLAREGLSPDRMILFGFSQGTMMALHVAPRRPEPVAGIVAFSGRLLAPERLATEALSKPPVILIHGDADEVVPPQSLNEAGEALQAAGFEVYAHVMRGTGHGIAPDGLSVALAFMRDKLGFDGGERG